MPEGFDRVKAGGLPRSLRLVSSLSAVPSISIPTSVLQ
jgi:hypothetical protein